MYPDNLELGFFARNLHRVATSGASIAFLVLLMRSLGSFPVSQPLNNKLFAMILYGLSWLIFLIIVMSPLQDLASSGDLGQELSVNTGRQPELPAAFLHIAPETQQAWKGVPPEELAKALKGIDDRITPDLGAELLRKGTVEVAKQHLGPDLQEPLQGDPSTSFHSHPALDWPLAMYIIVDIAQWGSVIMKAFLLAMAITLKRTNSRNSEV